MTGDKLTSKGRGPLGLGMRCGKSQTGAGREQQKVPHSVELWIRMLGKLEESIALVEMPPEQLYT